MDRKWQLNVIQLIKPRKEELLTELEAQVQFVREHLDDVAIVQSGSKWQLKELELQLLNYMILKYNLKRMNVSMEVVDENFERPMTESMEMLCKKGLVIKNNISSVDRFTLDVKHLI